ncbi:SusD/RagB family nutrient-binding outer membrane lipoprotein [Ulvibacter antarcticus]|uniref:SusD-like starch-binding protein associating with outer membrane n=1 Tax=Ulvibacter antarcticus TaxID=442714 RepID=A0A3L9YE32_9FLAO|nr:SusD/RagB family nutrient-binding outer membrane lipoprotein [Ulvibacter antarcticus]RMA57707.1 SusD-like starch-binding protein associating with outer membrane [Ulvibacter antarcticus]
MKKLILILVTVFIAVSCSDSLESLNENIKDPSAVSGESLFISAEKQLVDQMVSLNVNQNNTKLWVQYLQESTYTDESNYDQVTRQIPENHWSALYKDVLKDLNEASKVIEATTYSTPELNAQKPNKQAIIEILTVYTYANLVETFGDVPYTEALDSDNLAPAYDDALTIYTDLISRLTAASNALNTGIGSFGADDERIYDGNTASWKKFANSLKLRMGITLSDVNPALAQSTVENAFSAGLISSSADNAAYTYSSSDPNTNPLYVDLVLSGRQDFIAGKTLTDIMNAINDPRRPLYLEPVDGLFVGGEIGSASAYADHSKHAAQFQDPTLPGLLMDYIEVEFLLAEAAARGYAVGGTAKNHYDAGITASITFWGGTATEASDFLAQATVDYNSAITASSSTPAWKQVIGTQRWLALFNRGMESWTSIRRLDYPVMAEPTEALSGYPNRYTYPTVEQTLNGESYDAAAAAIGGDAPETKLFFDMF